MANRLDLHRKFEEIPGVKKAYFQPPESVKLKYPCIMYELSYRTILHAENAPYFAGDRYTVTVIDFDPDSKIHEFVGRMPTASFDRSYEKDNLNHWIYTLYH